MNRNPDCLDVAAIRDRITVLGMAESFFQSSVLFALARLNLVEPATSSPSFHWKGRSVRGK
jgi:hypothetical protein